MKALVLAGGLGTRLRPFSHSMPKQLMPVAGKPVLTHLLEQLRELGVREVGVIVGDGDRGAQIRTALGDGARLGLSLTYIPQHLPLGLAHCVVLAREFLGDEDFVMLLGDQLLTEGVQDIAGEFRARRPDAQLVVHKVADPRAFGVAEIDENGRVTELVEKPAAPRSDLALIGVYFLTPAIHEAVAAIEPSARGELEITDALQWLVSRGADVRARTYSGFWKDTGEVEDILECNRELLDRLAPSVSGEVDAESEVYGPVVIEPGARVERSRLVGPLIVGAGSVVRDSRLGPHTSIGRSCRLTGAEVGYSILLDGAEVRCVSGVHGSIVGQGASVTADVLTACGRLVVGDHSSVEFAA